MREGKDKYARKYMSYLEIDYTLIEPGEMMVTDHHQCDWWVCDGKKQYRPWLTVVQDMRTRCIVGWHLGESPHQDAIIAAYLMAFRDWSIPEKLRIDNGKDFTSKLLTGVTKRERDALRKELGSDYMQTLQRNAQLVDCTDSRYMGIAQELGIELIYAVPYQPWSKGQIERLFGTLEGQLGKTMYTYCGNSVLHKPEYLEEIRRGYSQDQKRALRKQYGKHWKKVVVLKLVDQSKIPTLEASREAIGEWIDLYHNAQHSADDMDGRTPLEVWRTATTLRKSVSCLARRTLARRLL